MITLTEVYDKGLSENEKNQKFLEEYLKELESLDFNQFLNKLKVPVLVPIGGRIFFRGELKHTNEITVALGANYFTKCSVDQAEVLRHHRIKEAKSKLEILRNEKEYLERQVTFNKNYVFGDTGKDIVEYQTLEEDKIWRQKHRENVRQYKQQQAKIPKKEESMVTNDELWTRLEELELQEELEEELLSRKGKNNDSNISILEKKTPYNGNEEKEIKKKNKNHKSNANKKQIPNSHKELQNKSSGMEYLQTVLDKQNVLEQKLNEMKKKIQHSNDEMERNISSILGKKTPFNGNEENEKTKKNVNRKSNATKKQMPNSRQDLQNQSSEMEFIQIVLDKQNLLEQKLNEVRNKLQYSSEEYSFSISKTEADVLSRLDEIEKLDKLEDELDRLDDAVKIDDADNIDDAMSEIGCTITNEKVKRNVSFADEDDSQTLEIVFTHSSVEPLPEPYNETIGITKPSDIYEAYAHLFTSTTSILKQSNYNIKQNNSITNSLPQTNSINLGRNNYSDRSVQETDSNKTIVIQDIAEKVVKTTNRTDNLGAKKPMSLFKQKRLQKK